MTIDEALAELAELDNAPVRCKCQQCQAGREVLKELSRLTAENARLEHIVECAATPLMADVLKERDNAVAENAELREVVESVKTFYPNCAQLFDGWHCDIAWSQWDTSVREELTAIGKLIEAAEAAKGADK